MDWEHEDHLLNLSRGLHSTTIFKPCSLDKPFSRFSRIKGLVGANCAKTRCGRELGASCGLILQLRTSDRRVQLSFDIKLLSGHAFGVLLEEVNL